MTRQLSLLWLLLMPAFAWCDEASDLLDKALAAHAKKPELLDKTKTVIVKSGGSILSGEKRHKIQSEFMISWPGTLRWEQKLDDLPKLNSTICLKNQKGWYQSGNQLIELTDEMLETASTDTYAFSLSMIGPLKLPGATLTLIDREKIDGKACPGIKIARRGLPDVLVYFHPETYLMQKLSYKCRDNRVMQKKDWLFSLYTDVDGLSLPKKRVLVKEGESYLELDGITYQFTEKHDDKLFLMPGK